MAASGGPFIARGDAKGILQSIVKRRAKSPPINEIVAEIQLMLGHSAQELSAVHWWSEYNALADTLSRMQPGTKPPQELNGCQRDDALRRNWLVLGKLRNSTATAIAEDVDMGS